MRNLLRKELRLCASPLSFFFLAFGAMFLLPGYPVLCGAFFITLGIFQSFLNAAQANDIVFSALLPIAKRDVVKAKYLFACLLELSGFLLMTVIVILRMTVLSDSAVYRSNALMNANPFALGAALLLFGLFNLIFIGGFFKTAYKLTGPFVLYAVLTFVVIASVEALHFIPGLEAFNAFGFDHFSLQICAFGLGMVCFILLTVLSFRRSCRNFEKIDL